MRNSITVLIAEDDSGHADLIRRNLRRVGISNEFMHFSDGQQVLDFLQNEENINGNNNGKSYLLLLDIRMPKMDGVEVLKEVKSDPNLKTIPVIMLTTTDDPKEVKRCHSLGCSNYITKPVNYEEFIEAVRRLGLFLEIVQIPELEHNNKQ